MSSSVSGIIKLMDLAIAATTAYQELSDSMNDIRSKLEQAQAEGRDLTWDEVGEAQGKLQAALDRARKNAD